MYSARRLTVISQSLVPIEISIGGSGASLEDRQKLLLRPASALGECILVPLGGSIRFRSGRP